MKRHSSNHSSHNSTPDNEVTFKEWVGEEEQGEEPGQEVTALDNSNNDSWESDEDDNHLFEPTPSKEEDEADEDFCKEDYVDEVAMKQEEDAQERKKEAQEKAAAAGKVAKGTRQPPRATTTTNTKRKSTDCSPRSQEVGNDNRKKAHVPTGPKTSKSSSIYKQVNQHSQNRRACQRLTDSAATLERTNRWTHQFTTRATFRIKIPAVEKPDQALSTILQEFIQELRRVDSSAAILPWRKGETRMKRIVKPEDIPSSVTQLRKYLKKFYVGKPNQAITVYPGIHIGHNKTFGDICEELQDWLDIGSHALFYMMLQAEESTEIGWLLYTTREMDAGAMVDEIADLVGVKVGL